MRNRYNGELGRNPFLNAFRQAAAGSEGNEVAAEDHARSSRTPFVHRTVVQMLVCATDHGLDLLSMRINVSILLD